MSAASREASPRRAILIGPLFLWEARTRSRELSVLKKLRISAARDLVIGIDGGTEVVLGLRGSPRLLPHWAVGDWDSLKGATRGARLQRLEVLERELGIRTLSLSQDKDRSDTAHAIALAARLGARELICLGLTGGRPDHHHAVLLELSQASGFESVRAIGPEGEYSFLSAGKGRPGHPWRQRLKRGQIFSVFAIQGPARGVTIRGARYPLENAVLAPSSRGLSNVSLGSSSVGCEVSVDSGRLLIIVPNTRPNP